MQYSGQVPENMQYSGQIKILQYFGKGAQLCVIQDRFKNVTYAIIQSDSKIMQYSGRGADDSKYCNIRGRSSRVQCSGQVEEVAQRRVAERRVAESEESRRATSRGATVIHFCPLSSIFREVQYSGQVPQKMQYSGQIKILQYF